MGGFAPSLCRPTPLHRQERWGLLPASRGREADYLTGRGTPKQHGGQEWPHGSGGDGAGARRRGGQHPHHIPSKGAARGEPRIQSPFLALDWAGMGC